MTGMWSSEMIQGAQASSHKLNKTQVQQAVTSCGEPFSKCLGHPTGARIAQATVSSPLEENRGRGAVFEGKGDEREHGHRDGCYHLVRLTAPHGQDSPNLQRPA